MFTTFTRSNCGAAALMLTVLFAFAAPARADVIQDMSLLTMNTMNATGYPQVTDSEKRPTFILDMPTAHIAMYDATNAIAKKAKPFTAVPSSPTLGAAIDYAAAAATCQVLAGLFPNRLPVYQSACAPYQSTSAGTPAQLKGIAVGIEVGNDVLAFRANDGRMNPITYTPTGVPGDFVPVPATPLPVSIYIPFVRPFTMSSAMQFRAYGPPDITSAIYARDFNETKAWGGTVSALRTPDNEELARFATENPATFVPRNWAWFANSDRSIADNARLLAMIWVSAGDSFIALFDSKYFYRFWRPQTAIPQADVDGNPATDADTSWTPFVPTPNHPEYPAGHGCDGGVTAAVLTRYFHTKWVSFDVTSTVTNTTRHYENVYPYVHDLQDARIYGGMHWRNSVVAGTEQCKQVSRFVMDHNFQLLHPWPHEDDDDEDSNDQGHGPGPVPMPGPGKPKHGKGGHD